MTNLKCLEDCLILTNKNGERHTNESEKLVKEVNNYTEQYINLNGENIKKRINDMIKKARSSEKNI